MKVKYETGLVASIAGPVVLATGLRKAAVYDVVHVGFNQLVGEVIRLGPEGATIQVYEETAGLKVGEPVVATGAPLTVELGPGLLSSIFDGMQRPLKALEARQGPYLKQASQIPALDRKKRWSFVPTMKIGSHVTGGDCLGFVQETEHLAHRILVPPRLSGQIESLAAGEFTLDDAIGTMMIHGGELVPLRLSHRWPVRQPRPVDRKLASSDPLISGQRVLDTFFPVARGGTAIIPGGFGTGKTVLEQTLAKWSDAQVVIYIGCGERGNEMTEVLEEFPHLLDPKTGAPLLSRTVLIANTSNMPVAAREASIYTGITIAEYYRDIGYDVALLADSTSRWGEALREISGRLEELPGAEGYPAYLGSRISSFYERSGRVETLGTDDRVGSLTIIGAVSPPGADFSEPMTQGSLRVAGAFWALDHELSRKRHFPAIQWLRSYSLYELGGWFRDHIAPDWPDQVEAAQDILRLEAELLEVVQLVGEDGLSTRDKALLRIAERIREDFLQQYAFDEEDAYCQPEKQYWMLRSLLSIHRDLAAYAEKKSTLPTMSQVKSWHELSRMRAWPREEARIKAQQLMQKFSAELAAEG